MATFSAKVSDKGWVVIPVALRRKLGLRAGDRVHFVEVGGTIQMLAATDDELATLRAELAGASSLSAALLQERRQEWDAEERRYWEWSRREEAPRDRAAG